MIFSGESAPGAHLFARVSDLWLFAQVAEYLGLSRAHDLRLGTSRFDEVIRAADQQLKRERPEIYSLLEERSALRPDALTHTVAQYMLAAYFEELGDTQTASRVRCGGAHDLHVRLAKLAIARLARALDCLSGDEFTGDDWSSWDDIVQHCGCKLRHLVAKFILAEVTSATAPVRADDLRSGSSLGWAAYWEQSERTIAHLKQTAPEVLDRLCPRPSSREPDLADLFEARAAGEITSALKSATLGVDVTAHQQDEGQQVEEVVFRALSRLMRQLAAADRAFSISAETQRVH